MRPDRGGADFPKKATSRREKEKRIKHSLNDDRKKKESVRGAKRLQKKRVKGGRFTEALSEKEKTPEEEEKNIDSKKKLWDNSEARDKKKNQ